MRNFAFISIVTFPLVNGQGNPLLFLGPGRDSSGETEVFTMHIDNSEMTKSSCAVPSYPLPDIDGAVGFVTPEGLELCGGYTSESKRNCYSLKNSSWTEGTPMKFPRAWAAAVRLQNGSTLVTGGYSASSRLRSSELLTGSTWTTAMELPSGRSGHCLLQLTSGPLFLHGGDTASGAARDTYISANLTKWTTLVSSSTARRYHACTEVTINSTQQVWLGGGHTDGSSEIYQLAQDVFVTGPNLPNYLGYHYTTPGALVSYVGKVYYAGGSDNKNIYRLKEGWTVTPQDAWTKIGQMSHGRETFPARIISLNICKGIKPTPTPLIYNNDGSVGYLSGSLVPIVTGLASDSPESQDVRCCSGVSGETTTTTCGNGTSCNNVCSSYNSGCLTVICEECHTSLAENQICDASMEEELWCVNADTIQRITNQCGTLKRKRSVRASRAAWGITTRIINISYCTTRCTHRNSLPGMKLCCLHPYVRRNVPGAVKDCCDNYGLCF